MLQASIFRFEDEKLSDLRRWRLDLEVSISVHCS